MNTTISKQTVRVSEAMTPQLEEILSRAMELDRADMGNIQVYDHHTESLFMINQQGFDKDFLDAFYIIKPFSPPSCGRSIGLGIPITIDDVLTDASLRRVLNLLKFRSVRSIPVLDPDRRKLGVITTHSKSPDHRWVMDQTDPLIKELAKVLKAIRADQRLG
jgi:hypothetical protein